MPKKGSGDKPPLPEVKTFEQKFEDLETGNVEFSLTLRAQFRSGGSDSLSDKASVKVDWLPDDPAAPDAATDTSLWTTLEDVPAIREWEVVGEVEDPDAPPAASPASAADGEGGEGGEGEDGEAPEAPKLISASFSKTFGAMPVTLALCRLLQTAIVSSRVVDTRAVSEDEGAEEEEVACGEVGIALNPLFLAKSEDSNYPVNFPTRVRWVVSLNFGAACPSTLLHSHLLSL